MMSEPKDQFVPKSDYERMEQFYNQKCEQVTQLIDRVEQLEDAIGKSNIFQKAVDIASIGKTKLIIPTWQQAREMAMDLLHVPVGNDNVTVIIEYQEGKLIAIRPET